MMSKEAAQSFVEKMRTDKEFAAQAAGCQTPADLVRFAKQAGYDLSQDEAQAVAGTLSDDELEAVAGGKYVRKIP